ncbi:MAG: glycosyltransferase family 4 protein [Candidatus Moranbacteria bacterium]|nr:glycosyltransferase family 4 protein [Candidatus Moranbacteria bacterium]
MRICIDIRCLTGGRRTGVEEYTTNLLRNIFEIDKENEYVLFLNSFSDPEVDLSLFSGYPNVSIRKMRLPNKLLNFLFWYFSWPKIDLLAGGADVVFMPNIIFGSVSRKAKLVATIHDLSFERYGRFFSRKRRWWHMFVNPKRICRRAEKIIAVSDSTRKDIGAIYGIDSRKISVIHSSVADEFRVLDRNDGQLIEVKEKYKLPFKFILYLGTIEPRKNIIGIIRAFDDLQRKAIEAGNEEIKKYSLVLAGEKGWLSGEIFEEIGKSSFKEKIIVPGFIDDADKAYVYNLASLFVYPSFFEGFGFPPLEAMKCGVPVITSNNSSMPEICGDAAILIDPDKPDEISRAIFETLSDKEIYRHFAQKGIEKASEFDWKKTAKKTLETIRQA